MDLFDKKLKKLIAQYAIEHNYEFCLPPKRQKYSFRSADKIPLQTRILDKNNLSPFEDLTPIYWQNPNWIIDEGGSKLFTYLMRNSDPEFKSQLCSHYSTFSQFKNIIGYLINNKQIDLAKEFFVSARKCSDKIRSSQEEESLINKIFSIYTNKKEFLKDLPIFLKNQFGHYDHPFDKRDKQFMLYHFVNNKFKGDELLKPIFKLLPEKPLIDFDDFLEIPEYKTEIMKIHRKKFMSSFSVDNVSNAELVGYYERIMHHVTNFLNTEFNDVGLSKCFRVHQEEFDNDKHEYLVLAIRLEKNHKIEMVEIKNIFIKSSLFLAENGQILQDNEAISKAFEDLNRILIEEKLSNRLAEKRHSKPKKI